MSDETRLRITGLRPEALLVVAQKESRGRLKIFLGARRASARPMRCCRPAEPGCARAPTWSSPWSRPMAARKPRSCLEGFEILPRRHVVHNGQSLEEMDLDALLDRRPGLALVDELAHTNAPGSRHPKRYMDVEELLAAGIDVFTHPQHPARREPQRRRRPDHPHPGARDGAGFDHRARRRDRAD